MRIILTVDRKCITPDELKFNCKILFLNRSSGLASMGACFARTMLCPDANWPGNFTGIKIEKHFFADSFKRERSLISMYVKLCGMYCRRNINLTKRVRYFWIVFEKRDSLGCECLHERPKALTGNCCSCRAGTYLISLIFKLFAKQIGYVPWLEMLRGIGF